MTETWSNPEIVWSGVTNYTGPCAYCQETILRGERRSKVVTDMTRAMGGTDAWDNGNGHYVHPSCAFTIMTRPRD